MKHYESDHIRSIVLAGHGGAGKTSIGDALARTTGLNNRLGSVSDGSSILDYEPEEKDRGGSLGCSFLSCEYDDYKVHVVDTPGDGDFIHDAHLAMQAVDACVLVVSAVDGIETHTEKMNALACSLELPRAIFINKLDRERASHASIFNELKESLGIEPVLLQLPIGSEAGFSGVVDLVNRKAYAYEGDAGKAKEIPVPEDMAADVEAAIEAMNEAVAMVDDELVERFLEEGELSEQEVRQGLNKGILTGAIAPVLLGSATKNIGIDKILWLTRAFPSPLERQSFVGSKPDAPEDSVEIGSSPSDPFAALCFKTIIDPNFGHLSLFRVLSGTVGTDLHPDNPRTGQSERFGSLFHLNGKKNQSVDKVTAGDIFAVAKLKNTETGDTLCDPKRPVLARWLKPPNPVISYVVKPLTRSDEDKVRGALDRILAEDRGLQQSFDAVTKEIVLGGMGTNHITIACHRMKRKYGVNVELGTPTIPYRETISGTADVRYRHKKQSGGAGQFGEVAIRVSGNERGGGFLFENKTVGGVIPSSLIPSVEKGVIHQLDKGILAGFPVVDVRVELYDGKSHPVDSKDIAFQIAGRQAIKQAVGKARPILLEPVYDVEVVGPEDNVGDIMGDLNQRRARIQTMEGRGKNSVVKATVPMAEMLNYAPALKSMTGGKGSYTMDFASYEPVPFASQDRLVKEISRIQGGEED